MASVVIADDVRVAVAVTLAVAVALAVALAVAVAVGVTPTVGVGVGVIPTVAVIPGVTAAVGLGVGVGVGDADTTSVTSMVTGCPTEGVITAVALYVPPASDAAFAENATDDDVPAVSLPLALLTESHEAEIEPMLHVSVPPPPLVMVTDCAAGLFPAFVE